MAETSQPDRKSLEAAFADAGTRVRAIGAHDPQAIESAAHRLSMLEARLTVPFLDIDVARMTADTCLGEIARLEAMDADALSRTPGIEESLEQRFGPSPTAEQRTAWERYVKTSRLSQLMRMFELVDRLRRDVPEAWDEIEELYFDD